MREFSIFNQILLSLFDISNTFHYSVLVCLHHLTYFLFNVIWETHMKHQINLQQFGLKD